MSKEKVKKEETENYPDLYLGAKMMGICGESGTGKSFSRSFMGEDQARESFVILPSPKHPYLFNANKKLLRPLNIRFSKDDGSQANTLSMYSDFLKKKAYSKTDTAVKDMSYCDFLRVVLKQLNAKGEEALKSIEVMGNHVMDNNINNLPFYYNLINTYYKKIKNIFTEDFTHFLSAIFSSDKFKSRTAGGEAYARFWDLAADVHNKTLTIAQTMRSDLLFINYYHAKYSEELGKYVVFIPGGKMLDEKFKLPSFYDYFFFTKVDEEEKSLDKRYKLTTITGPSGNSRDSGLYSLKGDFEISNNIGKVIDDVRAHNTIEFE